MSAFFGAYKPACGCMVAACVDDKFAAEDVIEWVRRGLSVARVDETAVRQQLRRCRCDNPLPTPEAPEGEEHG